MAEHDLQDVAFPKLTEAQMAALDHCPLTKRARYRDGEWLFQAGQCDTDFFVVKSGKVEVVDESGETPRTVRFHEPGEFTGEVAQLTGRPALVGAIARGDCEVYKVSPDALKLLLNDHPAVGDLIIQAFIARRHLLRESGDFVGVRVIGVRDSADTFRVREFLVKNGVPCTWLDLDNAPQVKRFLQQLGISESETPVVAWGRKVVLHNPSNRELARALGLCQPLEQGLYDLVVVGAGPAGLAAAVYAASEGLRTVVLERTAPGGQASRSMRIENYLGFPTGITGAELSERAVVQATKFGAKLPVATQAVSLSIDNGHSAIHVAGGEKVAARCVLIATGADYRVLAAEGCQQFEGRGVYYAATPMEAQMCRGSEVVVVGGGNSAGQAAVFLAGQVRKLYLVIRHEDLGKDMSDYLVKRIEQMPNIEVLRNAAVRRMDGSGTLDEVELVNLKTGEIKKLQTPALFCFIGAVPRTDWLPKEIEKDGHGFILTGPALRGAAQANGRPPFLLETSWPGVFAAGDVRAGSIKRVASSVGEGAMAVQFVHEYLKEQRNARV